MDNARGAGHGTAFILLLAALTALGQFGSNVFLPGMPSLAQDLGCSSSSAAWSYSLYLAALGATQLVAGPLSDRFGSRRTALVSALLFMAGGAIGAIAHSLPLLLAARVVQGIGAAGALVVSRAAARDQFSGAALARVMAAITIAFALVPGVAPMLGGVLVQYVGWRAILWSTALAGLLTAIWVGRDRALQAGVASASVSSGSAFAVYRSLLADAPFLRLALVCGLALGAMSAFLGASPRLFLSVIGISPVEYGIYPPIAILGFVIGGVFVRRHGERIGLEPMLRIGIALQLAACAVLVLPAWFGWLDKWIITFGMLILVTGLGVLMPVSMAAAMSVRQGQAGQTAALLGFIQMAGSTIGTILGNIGIDLAPAVGMQLVMTGITLLAMSAVLRSAR